MLRSKFSRSGSEVSNDDIGVELLKVFDSLFVINLRTRTDRRKEIEEQLAQIGLTFNDTTVRLFDAERPTTPGPWTSIGARGCFMSHLGIIQTAQRESLESIAIIEDDMDWTTDFLSSPSDTISQIAKDNWSYLHGGTTGNIVSSQVPKAMPVAPKAHLHASHFIGLRGRALELIGDYLVSMTERPREDPKGGPMPIDGAYHWFRSDHPELVGAVCTPGIAAQRSSKSDITPKVHDRIPGVSTLASAFRRLARKATSKKA